MQSYLSMPTNKTQYISNEARRPTASLTVKTVNYHTFLQLPFCRKHAGPHTCHCICILTHPYLFKPSTFQMKLGGPQLQKQSRQSSIILLSSYHFVGSPQAPTPTTAYALTYLYLSKPSTFQTKPGGPQLH